MVGPLEEWFHVTFDDDSIYIHIHAPGRDEIRESITWSEIIRVCFKTGDFLSPDEIYIFVSHRPESYLIPTEADGGSELWGEFIDRKLFDAELAIRAATAPENSLFCWPEVDDET
ncbi:MAG: hypothetical protein ACFFF4_14040 [Candidatus Thorarchaeota archaeon]